MPIAGLKQPCCCWFEICICIWGVWCWISEWGIWGLARSQPLWRSRQTINSFANEIALCAIQNAIYCGIDFALNWLRPSGPLGSEKCGKPQFSAGTFELRIMFLERLNANFKFKLQRKCGATWRLPRARSGGALLRKSRKWNSCFQLLVFFSTFIHAAALFWNGHEIYW